MKRLLVASAIASTAALILATAGIFIHETGKANPNVKDRGRGERKRDGEGLPNVEKNLLDDDVWPDPHDELPPSNVKLPEAFKFKDTEADLAFSLVQYNGSLAADLDGDLSRPQRLLRFVRGGKDVLVVQAHTKSVFRSEGNRFFFALFSPSACGCAVDCYELEGGKRLWRTRLMGVGLRAHSGYTNQVTMDLHTDYVLITGKEGYGDYVEALDRKTGRALAHRIYREGYPLMPWQKETPTIIVPVPTPARR